jgi:hypothetical protein
MFNNNSSNLGANFGANNNNSNNDKPVKFRLQITAVFILILAILKLIFGNYQGFQSDLFIALFILLVTYCSNGFIAGYLIISLLFDLIITSVFFLLQLQNSILQILNPMPSNRLITLWIINIISFILYTIAIFFCYRLFSGDSNSSNISRGGYSILNDTPVTQNQRNSYGTMNDRERNIGARNNFQAFNGKGSTLDG